MLECPGHGQPCQLMRKSSKPENLRRGFSALLTSLGREDNANNQAIQRQSLSENEDEDHSYKELGLLSIGPDSRVSHDSDGHACC
mmetsp:Transcript_24700/g.63644  ORF Transcript_24700/g.63644 Transcript_24700/m.63644 type:complete len:85 (+) Transcript_24700:303-557(+)